MYGLQPKVDGAEAFKRLRLSQQEIVRSKRLTCSKEKVFRKQRSNDINYREFDEFTVFIK